MIATGTGGRKTAMGTDNNGQNDDLDSLVGALHSSIANVRLTTSQQPVHPLDPVDSYEAVANLLPAHRESLLQNLYSSNRSEHLRAVNVIRKYCSLSGRIEEHVKNIMPLNILPRIVELFKVPDGILQYETSWILTNICANVPEAGADVVAAGAVPVLVEQLLSPSWRIAWQAIWTLGNILCTQETHRAVVTTYPDIIPRLLQVVNFSNYDIPDGEMKEAKTCLNEQCVRALANVAMFPGIEPRSLYAAFPFLAENIQPNAEQKALSHAIRGLKLIIGLINGPLEFEACSPELCSNLASTLRHAISAGPSYNSIGAIEILNHIAVGGPQYIQRILQAPPAAERGWGFVLRQIAQPRDWRSLSSEQVKSNIVPFVARMTSGTKEQSIAFLKSGGNDPLQIWQYLGNMAAKDAEDRTGRRDAITALLNLIALEEPHLDAELVENDIMKLLLEYFKLSCPPQLQELSAAGASPTSDPSLFLRISQSFLSLLTVGATETVDPTIAAAHTYGGPSRFAERLFVAAGFDIMWEVWARLHQTPTLGTEYDKAMVVLHQVMTQFYGNLFSQRYAQFKELEEMSRRVGGMGIV